jgi:hypothetical protein
VSSEAQRLLDGLFAIAPELTDADEIPAYTGHLHATNDRWRAPAKMPTARIGG